MSNIVKIIPLNETHFEDVTDYILKFYEEDPLEFLFIGPSGYYVKNVADCVAAKINKTLNRDSFQVLNQYVTELLREEQPDANIIDRDFLKVFIKKEIDEIIEKEKSDDEFSQYLKILNKSKRSSEYILDIFQKKWEIKNTEEDSYLEYAQVYMDIEKTLDTHTNLYKLYKMLEEKLEDILKTKFDDSKDYNKNFDPISVYKWFYNEYKGKKNKTIIISGFFDLTPIMCKVLENIFDIFENVHFLIWQDIEDRSFNSLSSVYEFIAKNNFSILNIPKNLKKLFSNKKMKIYQMSDSINEVEKICKEIKNKILTENIALKDFGIVIPDNSLLNVVSEYFEEINIPYHIKNDIPLSKSQIVNILLQPFKTITRGYETDDIIACIEDGFAGEINLTVENIENYLIRLNLMYDVQKSSLSNRREKWLNKINEEIKLLKIIKKNTEEEERVEKELNEITELRAIFEKLFSFFYEIEYEKNKKRNFKIEDIRKFIKKWFEMKIIDLTILKKYIDERDKEKFSKEIKSEYNALKYFESFLFRLEKTSEKIFEKNKKISLEKIFRMISDLIEVETYRDSEKHYNCIEIMNLLDSRFVYKRYKYFLNFTENNYPSISINPFLSAMTDDGKDMAKTSEKISRRNLFISMIFSDNIIFSYPKATLSGNQILSSPYEKEFIKLFNVEIYIKYENKKEVIINNPEEIYSKNEAMLYYINKNIETDFLNLNEKKEEIYQLKKYLENHKWDLDKKIKINYLSHSKLSNYVDCPLKYYYSSVAYVKGEKNFDIFSEGLIKHSVMSEIAEKKPFYSDLRELMFENEKAEEFIKKIIEKVWDEKITNVLHKYQAVKIVEINRISQDIFLTLESLLESYLEINKKTKIDFSQTIFTEKKFAFEYHIENFGKINIETRIDRFDLTNANYTYVMDKFENEIKKPAYCIIDLKNSENSYQSEQLFLYYLGLINDDEYKEKLKDKDIYLRFHPFKQLKKASNKFIKIQNDLVIILKKGSSTNFIAFNFHEFNNWLIKTLKEIEKGSFYPIATKERIIKRFLEEMNEKYECMKNEKYYECGFCEYKNICNLLEYLKDFEIKKDR